MIITPKPSLVNIVSHKHMRYLFQNVHKSRKTVHDLLDSRRNAIDILFVQEAPINFVQKVPSATNPEGDDLVGPVIHKAWTCVDRRLAFPNSAVAIYVNRRLTSSYQLFPVEKANIHQDVLILHLKHNFLKGHDFTVANVYNRPGARNAAVSSFMEAIPSFPDLALVEGDFNLHSPIWDDTITKGSPAALALYVALSDAGLNLMNDDFHPTWTNRRGSQSVIDLLFVNDRLLTLEPAIEVSLDNRGRSDHAILTCLFGSQVAKAGRPYIASESEEEDEFCFYLGSALASLPTILPDMGVEETCQQLSQIISDKWDSLAKMPITSRPHGASWWNDQCQAYRDAREVIAGLPPLVTLLNAQLHGFRARITALPSNHILCTAMTQKWTNPAYASISRKTRPAHLPSDVPFRRLRTHRVQEQFEHSSDLQRPGCRVLDTFVDRITIDTYSPAKGTDSFKAWVRDLKQEIE